jgi:hypothetical protein
MNPYKPEVINVKEQEHTKLIEFSSNLDWSTLFNSSFIK